MTDKMVKMLSTWFYIGYFPFAPGSMASVAGVLIYLVLGQYVLAYILLFVVVTVLGFMVSGPMEKLIDSTDPSCVVIDEISGIMLAFFLLPAKWPIIVTAFFLFRAFDMFKIYPGNKFEELHGGVGIMMDDVMAGVYTNIVMHIAIRWAGIV